MMKKLFKRHGILSHFIQSRFMHPKFMQKFFIFLILGFVFIVSVIAFKRADGKDFGVQGHTSLIQEEDLLELLLLKLRILEHNGILQQAQEELKLKAVSRIKNPQRVEGIERVEKYHRFIFDPTLTVPTDIKDHKGTLIHKAGTKVNPLHHMPFKQTWFFIEGDDLNQVTWALEQVQEGSKEGPKEGSKIILVSGSPFDLSEKHGYRFYFDQLGKITSKIGIKRVPSKLRRDLSSNDIFLIEEIPLNGGVHE